MKRSILFLAVLAALLAPAGAFASGVVLKVQPASHLVAVSRSAARVSLVHTSAAARLHVGQRVAMTARRLGNGTLSATTIRIVGRAHTVRFRGLLLAKTRAHLLVSTGGAVLAIRRGSRSTSTARDDVPRVGSQIAVQAIVGAHDELDEDHFFVVAPMAPGGSLEGWLTLGTTTVTISSEHLTLVLNVPAGFSLTGFRTGDEVFATFAQQPDGTLTLTKLARDDDRNDDHGDDRDGDGGGHHGGGDGGGGSGHHDG
jgi:hypothetical protein